ncbi:alanine--glyoxylate aminotransferase family protein [Candidatus Woesearchaeota archaeon]|nr:alanine--glyoxylate aminotransferase family protein [Candidatus Woesearchaeota archaeon]
MEKNKKIFFTPGPTQLYPNVAKHIKDALSNNICSISHRSREFEVIFSETTESLKRLLNIPNGFHVFFLSSATEAMERIIENCVAEHSFHFIGGSFSERFYIIAKQLMKSPEKLEAEFGKGFEFDLEIPGKTELICFTQNETSSGVAVDMEDIYAIKKKNPEKLVAVDIVSSVPYVNIEYSLVDCTFFSVQKGFGLPAGLGVLIVNDRCIEKSKLLSNKGYNIGSYHSLLSLLSKAEKRQTVETPNILDMYLLREISKELNNIGIEKIREETEEKANMIYDFFDRHELYSPFVQDKGIRSKTTIAIKTPNGSGEVINRLSEKGFVVGSGYGVHKNEQIRIANFPMHRAGDIKKMLRLI